MLFGAVVEAPPVPVVLPFEDEPGVEPLAAEPPDMELVPAVAPPACASAKVLESTNAVANAIVVSFMGRFLVIGRGQVAMNALCSSSSSAR